VPPHLGLAVIPNRGAAKLFKGLKGAANQKKVEKHCTIGLMKLTPGVNSRRKFGRIFFSHIKMNRHQLRKLQTSKLYVKI
jgi:hypothetical protein